MNAISRLASGQVQKVSCVSKAVRSVQFDLNNKLCRFLLDTSWTDQFDKKDSGVGKSCIVQRFVHNTFNPSVESTIGASFMTKCLLVDDSTYKFNIWDTAGQERYRSLAPMYYRNAGASIIVYDVTSYTTFQSVKGWIRELQLHGSSNVIMAIAGNKADLEGRREVPNKEAKEYADSVNAAFVETSALTAVNIHELFKEIALRLPRIKSLNEPKHEIQLTDKGGKKRKCCSSN